MSEQDVQAFRQRMQRVETLVQALEQVAVPATRDAARELMQALLDLHRAGLARVLGLIGQTAEGEGITAACVRDDMVSGLLLLHGLHPVDLETRVRQALGRARPFLRGHGADAELLTVSGGVVRLRLLPVDDSGLSSAQGLQHVLEEAVIEAAPDVSVIEIEGPAPRPTGLASGRVPLPLVS